MEKAGCPVLPRMIRAMNCMSTNHNGSYGSGLGVCDSFPFILSFQTIKVWHRRDFVLAICIADMVWI